MMKISIASIGHCCSNCSLCFLWLKSQQKNHSTFRFIALFFLILLWVLIKNIFLLLFFVCAFKLKQRKTFYGILLFTIEYIQWIWNSIISNKKSLHLYVIHLNISCCDKNIWHKLIVIYIQAILNHNKLSNI